MRRLIYFMNLLLLFSCVIKADQYPHIIVNDRDKKAVLQKIEKEPWAKAIFDQTKERLSFYVEKHQSEPDWILDRYLMNRIPGKRYTEFISDESGTQLIAYRGDAPVPTVRVSSHKRVPITPEGKAYILPEIKDIIPKDTSLTMNLLNPVTKKYEKVDPQAYIGTINGKINELAFEASVLYWLTGNDKYAKFAADILDQWVNAVVYQEPIKGPGRTGFLDIQTLGDEKEKPLILAYDFLQPYLKKNQYLLVNYESVFEKIAWTLSFRGYAVNNWYAAESSTLVASALSLKNTQKRNYYLDFYLNKDTVVDGCGQLGLPSTVKKWFTPDGHWKEPGGYHNYPVSKLIEAAMMLENNGYQIFNKYPELLKAAYVMLKYSFPNITTSSFGDTGRPKQSIECLESAIKMAEKYSLPILVDLTKAAHALEKAGEYDRKNTGIIGMLCFLPQLPIIHIQGEDLWNRTEKLDFASCYLQRNGMDRQNGLMCVVQGATYNHNHSNGMSMELYGAGTVMGIDPGNGPTYEHPMHVEYYTQWAAHNTVVAAGSSTSVLPFRGGGGTKFIGAVELESMEPFVGEQAISDDFSYTLTKYYEEATKTNQERLLSIVRVDDEHGMYVDFYWSDNLVSNDYLYHNIGDKVELYTQEGNILELKTVSSYPCVGDDKPGLRYFKSVQTTGRYEKDIVALFSAEHLSPKSGYMKMWMPSTPDISYFTALAPEAKTAQTPYQHRSLPVVAMRMEKAAVNYPFIAVYEPATDGFSGGIIKSVERIKLEGDMKGAAIAVETKQGDSFIFVNAPEYLQIPVEDKKCSGDWNIFAKTKGKNVIYIGNGTLAEDENFKIKAKTKGNFFLEYDRKHLLIRSNIPIEIEPKNKSIGEKLKGINYMNAGEKLFSLE